MSEKHTKKVKIQKQANGRLDVISGADYFTTILLIIAAAIVPMIVYMHPIHLSGILFDTWTGLETIPDFFSYNKAQVLNVLMVLLLIVLFYRSCIKKDMEKLPLIFIPYGVYLVFVLLSTIFSDYRMIALNGFTDRYEGLYIIIAYGVLTLFAYLVGRYEKLVIILLISIFVSSIFIAILGLTQFYGIDLLQTDLGKKLILPKEYQHIADSLNFAFAGQKIMYTTVYNPNYLGSYAALLLPVAIGFYYMWAPKGGWKIGAGLLFCAAVFILFLGGMSRAGLLGGGIAMLVFVVLYRKRIIRQLLHTLLIAALLLGIYVTMDITSGGLITREVKETLPSRMGFGEPVKVNDTDRSTLITELKVEGKELHFSTETETLIMRIINDKGAMNFLDAKGNVLTVSVEGEDYKIDDDRYELYRLRLVDGGIVLVWNDVALPVKVDTDNLYIQYREKTLLQELEEPESFGFKGLESFASNRGYIWSRSLPLLKDTILLGHGPDTYAIYFPQYDIRGKMNYLDNTTVVVDKPHNWYLQIGINTGIISLIAILGFLGWFAIKGLSLWFKQEDGMIPALGSAFVCGVGGYCIAGLFNDSTVSVAPVFWVIVGLGVAFIMKYEKKGKSA